MSSFAAALLALAALSTAPPAALGTWRNPKNTLAVRTSPCDRGALCGAIIWAAPKALSDAKAAGVARLIGTQLLQDYRPVGHGSWRGRVFVPDMGKTFSSRITQTGPDQLTISGCLFAGLLCRSQVWRRVT